MNKSDSINDLINRISTGDTNSFRCFYDHFFNRVLFFAHLFIKSEEICQEVVSDVFISVWLNKEKLADVENIEGYLFIITRNKSLNYLEKQSDFAELDKEILFEKKIEDSNPENILITKELEIVIQKSIDQLPERCRLIFKLSREEKLKHHQIAKILSISENTVHAQMMIALKKLHDILKKHIYSIF